MKNVKCLIAYSGTHYFGWQKAGDGPSIEATIEIFLNKILQEPVKLQAASRTDRGVHAEGQVINFRTTKDIDLHRLQGSLRRLLPTDISLLSVKEEKEDFHPTLDSLAKEYHYWICNSPVQYPIHREFSWHIPLPLDLTSMKKAAKLLIGCHDFSAFTTDVYDDPIRTVHEITLHEEGKRLCITVKGESFLYKMVRTIVGTLTHVGSGKLQLNELPKILESQDRRLAGMTAPAHGLTLKKIYY